MKKNIVLLSNSEKRALLKEFSSAYEFVLSKHNLFAPFEDSRVLSDIGLKCSSLLSLSIGGLRQIISKLQCSEFDLVIFFRDSCVFKDVPSAELEVLFSCDCYNIPIATNMLTAEILLRALDAEMF